MLAYLSLGFIVFAAALIGLYSFQRLRYPPEQSESFIDAKSTRMEIASIIPGGNPESSRLSPGSAFDPISEYLVESSRYPAMKQVDANFNWGKMTSEHCYRSDIGESLKKTRNYLQRTNNYRHGHPDSCSAPNHEFVGTFYTPFDGVGRTPATGANYPPSTAECPS